MFTRRGCSPKIEAVRDVNAQRKMVFECLGQKGRLVPDKLVAPTARAGATIMR